MIAFLKEIFRKNGAAEAIVWRDQSFTYAWLLEAVEGAARKLVEEGVAPGTVTSLEADFSPRSVALLLALVERGCTVVPLTDSVEAKKPDFRAIAQVETIIRVTPDDDIQVATTGQTADHELLVRLKAAGHPGLILFSSGSTGQSKAAVHDFVPLLEKFKTPRQAKRTIVFLLFDHIGGVNTLLHTLSNAGCVITLRERSPDAVAAAVALHKAQILPTSPTFINLLLLSDALGRHDISSLELITYGTEVMPETTLRRLHTALPNVRLQQTYGLSELGILRSKSRSADSLWVKVGGEGFETRIIDGMLEIKARSAMLGYLNAPSPFTADGWFKTGDRVEVDGEYLRILGRNSEIINVGGEKVYPAEVESVLRLMDGVIDVAVSGEANALTGNIVLARVRLSTTETLPEFRTRMRSFCRDKLPPFKTPQKVVLTDEAMYSARFKKQVRPEPTPKTGSIP
jgi:acyl-coenzyme A synthetase/AMP-(fatty) acid ligase